MIRGNSQWERGAYRYDDGTCHEVNYLIQNSNYHEENADHITIAVTASTKWSRIQVVNNDKWS